MANAVFTIKTTSYRMHIEPIPKNSSGVSLYECVFVSGALNRMLVILCAILCVEFGLEGIFY